MTTFQVVDDLSFIKQLYIQFSHVSLTLGCNCAGKGFYDLGAGPSPSGRQLAIDFFTGPRHGGHKPYLEYYGASNAD